MSKHHRFFTQRRHDDAHFPSFTPSSPIIRETRADPLLEGIAIIGMSGRFPKAKTLEAFWDNLAQGRDCISEVPASRWSIEQYYDPDEHVPGKTSCKWLGVVEDVDRFDPLFFNIALHDFITISLNSSSLLVIITTSELLITSSISSKIRKKNFTIWMRIAALN